MPHRPLRIGMTLIELLVVIVILTTLVGGVLPVLSPNNDARRIREAARGLQTYIMQAQALAARTGRPAGIAFRESSAGSGVALEAYQIEVPPPFAGFSPYSAGRVRQTINKPGNPLEIQLVLTNTLDPTKLPTDANPRVDLSEYTGIDQFPDRFIKKGDIVVVGGLELRLLDPKGELSDSDGFYFSELPEDNGQLLIPCELVDPQQTLAYVEPPYREVESMGAPEYGITAVKGYQIRRQPTTVTTGAAAPYQFPAGVCIDLQASGTEGGANQTQFATAKTVKDRSTDPTATDPARIKQLAIMFSPSGGIDSIHYNGTVFNKELYDNKQNAPAPITDASKIYLLLGRVENGGVNLETATLTTRQGGQTGGGTSVKDQIKEIQSRINWMNLDSRWMAIDARNGRVTVSENAFVDPSKLDRYTGKKEQIVNLQAQDARAFARSMQRGGER